MSDFDPVASEPEHPPANPGPAQADPTADTASGALSGVLDELVDKAVTNRLSAEAAAIAQAEFEAILTPELHMALAAAARQKLAAAFAAEQAAGELAEAAAKGPYYPNPYAFYTEFLALTYRRKTIDNPSMVWCPRWFAHPEARSRVEALWRAWEHFRLDQTTGLSVWWKDHADHHMSKLLSPEGPFKDCIKNHRQLHELPGDEIPAVFFDGTAATPTAAPAPVSTTKE